VVVGALNYFLRQLPAHRAPPVSPPDRTKSDQMADYSRVYVAMPKIAQNGVNESSLQFNYLEFLNPTEDSITLTQSATLYSPSIFTPTLDPFNASLYLVTNGTLAAEPMIYIPMPSIHAIHPQGNITINNQVIPIANLDQITDFATAVLANEYVTTALSGSTNLHEGALPVVNVNYNSQTTYKGNYCLYNTILP
jgi:Protein of unknown function (DUF3712)